MGDDFQYQYANSWPGLKGYVRYLSGYYLAARQLEFLVGRKSGSSNTDLLGDALGIAQHHDAVSGTEKQHTANDYAKRLAIGASQKLLAALLVEGLSGSSPAQILGVTSDFVHRLGLKQSLIPSRNNGFLNMLKLMQRKTLQVYLEAEKAGSSKDVNSNDLDVNGVNVVDEVKEEPPVGIGKKEIDSIGSAVTSRLDRIRQRLETELEPMVLEIEDVSHQHVGHAAMQDQAKETHFNVKIVSAKFEGLSLVKRHRLVYGLLNAELQSGLHALSITVKTQCIILLAN
ncbi:sufE-like protein 1, chloroplastic/mitochondrial [Cryptomeria japonica]|uniref:sufE-like protein 1, chloroplastic/mitochondrial n=1 Tax=Cryptomeria japonica TaxID=3369 RepID=UPI0027D9E9BA|nr:sufE-like protein 1, chloroplastic/mitochondrial [Cryptomeria japonica]